MTRSSNSESFSIEGKQKKLIKTGCNVTVIKPTSQQHNYPRLDPPISSVLTQMLHIYERKLTFIKQEVSNTYHNQRTKSFAKTLQIGSLAQPSTLTKYKT